MVSTNSRRKKKLTDIQAGPRVDLGPYVLRTGGTKVGGMQSERGREPERGRERESLREGRTARGMARVKGCARQSGKDGERERVTFQDEGTMTMSRSRIKREGGERHSQHKLRVEKKKKNLTRDIQIR